MPLDVQPLSPARRIIMLVVLLALLAASLGFAQYLVVRARNTPHPSPRLADPIDDTDNDT